MAEKKLTVETSLADFKKAYKAKRSLIERQREDFLFRLGKQWDDDKLAKMKEAGIEPITDNRIQPNIFLLTGLERQNRSDFKAFPQGEEDSLTAEIATALFKDATNKSGFGYKASESFEDGVTCGESALELYLDNTENILNGKPCWKKINGDMIFPEPGFKEYDYSDASYLYKLTKDISKEDLISLFPEMEKEIEKCSDGKINFESFYGEDEKHQQPKDYKKEGSDIEEDKEEPGFDLLERFYKKWVETHFVGDRKTGELQQAEDAERAESFKAEYLQSITDEQQQFTDAMMAYEEAVLMGQVDPSMAPPPPEPEPKDPERFVVIKRKVPEIWYFAHVCGIKKPLADERAWFYPKWKKYGIIPYFARFSTAPIDGDDRHLLVQGIVHGVKGAQTMHNSMETLEIMFLNSSANGGWLSPKDSWTDSKKVEQFGSMPGVNLEYDAAKGKPERIFPMQRSAGHAQIAESKAEAIKAQLGINADLLAVQDGSSSGRAIALRQRQGLLMVQQLFDNYSRTKQLCGQFLLSQLGEIYDTETAIKVLGKAFLVKNFPPPLEMASDEMGNPVMDPMGQPQQQPMVDPKTGQPMEYDSEMAELAIAEVLSGDLGLYDVAVGESVGSETMRMAQFAEMKELAAVAPMAFTPAMLVENSDLPAHMKNQAMKNIQNAQMMAQAQPPMPIKAEKKEPPIA